LGAAPFGTLICYETLFADLSRSFAAGGASFLASITNDAWYSWTAAPFQHASFAVLRAVENRIPVVRAGNTGVSMVVDARGRILSQLPIFEDGFLVTEVPLRNEISFYTKYGEWFSYYCLLFSVFGLCWRMLIKRA